MKPHLISRGNTRPLYEVVGASGESAGWVQRLYPRGWAWQPIAAPLETFEKFNDARREALTAAKRY